MQTNFIGGAWVLALKVLIHEYYWSCPLRLQYKKLLIFWCVCTCVVPSEKGPRDIERWELNWLYSLVQRILYALKIALVYKCLIFEKPHQFYNWKFSFLRVDAIFISFHDCEIIRGIWNKIYIIITVLYIVAYIWIIPGLMLSHVSLNRLQFIAFHKTRFIVAILNPFWNIISFALGQTISKSSSFNSLVFLTI